MKANKLLMRRLAAMPIPENVAKDGAKRTMYSVKSKRKVARYVTRHGIPATFAASVLKDVSEAQISAWVKDDKRGALTLSNSVCVSRR